MRAIQYKSYGPVEVLQEVDLPEPAPGPGQILIEIDHAAVNPIDWKLRAGKLRMIHPLKLPAIPGFDLAGTVVACHPQAQKFKPGDAVYARSNKTSGESHAELIALDEDVVALKPERLSFAQAAAIPLAALTALQAMRDRGQLQSGQRVLINGASGGVGVYAVQLARSMGAQITAVCSAANADLVLGLGAHQIIDYKTQDPLQTEKPYHHIFDAAANLHAAKARKVLVSGGRLITTVPNASVIRSLVFGNAFSSRKAGIVMVHSSGSDLEYINGIVQAGELQSPIDRTFKLSEIQAAHSYSAAGHARGKIVIQVKDA